MEAKQSEILERLSRIESLLTATQPPPLTVEEAAAFLHLSRQTIYRLTSQSLIPYCKVRKRCYFSRSDLSEWVQRNRVREVQR
jgi:excisionase family DNA binding protein